MAMLATCLGCNEFSVPADEIGAALMEEHQKENHPEMFLQKLKSGEI